MIVACAGESMPAPDIVASIDDEQVPYSEFEQYLDDNSINIESALASDVLSRLFDHFLEERLLRRMAADRGLVEETAPSRQAVQALMGELLASDLSEERIASYYRDHPEDFMAPERVRLRQVLAEDREVAERVRRALIAGTPFDVLRNDLAADPDTIWGDESELSAEDLPPVFAETIFGLEPGQVSEVIAADYGFHVFQVVERLPAEQVEVAEARETIRGILRREIVDQAVLDLVTEARESYNVRVFRRNIPFNYAGTF